MAQIKRNVIVVQALNDVAVQAGGEGHQLHAGQHLRALQGHAAGHNQADVAAAQDDHPAAGHIAHEVDELLGRAGGVDAGAAGAGGAQRAAGPLAAAHGQDDGACLEHLQAMLGADAGDPAVFLNRENRRVALDIDAQFTGAVDVPLGVFRAGQFLLEAVQAEAVMDALAQDAAGVVFALQDEQVIDAVLPGGDGGGQTRRARADHQHIHPLNAVCLLGHVSSPPSSRPEWCR